ncbi:hypothetical protein ASD43_04215 [Microbacterium sp. Root553]|nr:hypothetical protein ASD43_04215 [Microbacterium sp. Root553]
MFEASPHAPNDLFHTDSNTMVEVDEVQPFTSFRALTIRECLSCPGDRSEEYLALRKEWSSAADRYRATKEAKGFPGPWDTVPLRSRTGNTGDA